MKLIFRNNFYIPIDRVVNLSTILKLVLRYCVLRIKLILLFILLKQSF
jgi:hypothetical protein